MFISSFLLFLFLMPFQTVYLIREVFVSGEKWQYGTIGIYLSDFLLVAIFFFFIRRYSFKNFKCPSFCLFSLFLLILWSFVSIFFANDIWLALSSFLALFFASTLFLITQSLTGKHIKKIIFVLILSGVVQSGIGIAQFLSQKSINTSFFGMSSHIAYEAGSSVLKIDSGRFLRAYGTFSHPNILGLYLAVILILCIAYYVFGSIFEKTGQKIVERIILLSSIVTLLLGLIVTFSRSAWIGFFFGMMVIGMRVWFRKDFWMYIRFLKVLIVCIASIIVFGSILFQQIFPRFDMATIEKEGSITERIQSLYDARTLIGTENIFLFGTGIGNFTARMHILQPQRPFWNIQPAHNVFVLIMVELGVIGCIFFLFLLSSLWIHIVRSFKNIDDISIVFFCAIFTIVPSLLLDHFLWSSHFGILFLFFLFGMVSRQYAIERSST